MPRWFLLGSDPACFLGGTVWWGRLWDPSHRRGQRGGRGRRGAILLCGAQPPAAGTRWEGEGSLAGDACSAFHPAPQLLSARAQRAFISQQCCEA